VQDTSLLLWKQSQSNISSNNSFLIRSQSYRLYTNSIIFAMQETNLDIYC